jgi:phytoene dehydrogenase-like protein
VEKYEVIIIGGGPNGLATGAYLAKSGLKTLIVDRRLEVGGGLWSERVTLPQFLHNTHAVWHLMVDFAPVHKDFDLETKYNVRYVWPELQFAMPLADGRCLCLYRDVDRSCQSIAEFSKADAESYREFRGKLDRYMEAFLAAGTYVPPVPPFDQLVKLEATEIGKEIASYSEKTPKEIVSERFENEHVRTMMLYLACFWGIDPEQAGIGYLVLLTLNRATNYRYCLGGSHHLAAALLKVILENGGLVYRSRLIKRIIVDNGVARGIEFEDGTTIEAEKAIVSTIDPHQTFLKYIGEDRLPRELTERVKDWQWEKWSLLSVHLALEEPPHFIAASSNPDIDRAAAYIVGYETMDDVLSHWQAIEKGELYPHSGFTCSFPSIFDPLQAPQGKCSGLIAQMAPYELSDGGAESWLRYKFKQQLARQRVAVLQKHAPNITEEKVMSSYVVTPADIENRFPNMVRGSIKHGAYHPLQMGFLRPNELCSSTRTPVKNLYLGGASCHSGGLVTFGPGYRAACTLAEDLKIEKWWPEPECVTVARDAGLL